jgi:GMP synthase PP-ATPase subunit
MENFCKYPEFLKISHNCFCRGNGSRVKGELQDDKVVLGLGGVDSTVAVLLHQALEKNLYCIL